MDYLFLSTSIANTLGHHTGLHRIKTEYIWHVYFYILTIYVWKTEMLPYNSSIFFIFDLYNHMLKNKLGIFTIFHHSLALLLNVVSIFKNPLYLSMKYPRYLLHCFIWDIFQNLFTTYYFHIVLYS